jgi:hypothetical protein
MPPTSPITRSWKLTFLGLAAALALTYISYLFWAYVVTGTITAGFACIFSILALIMFYFTIRGANQATCPLCGKRITMITDSGDPTLCPFCHKYLNTKNKTLSPTDDNAITDTPSFACKLPAAFIFPAACCVCGKPADHRQHIEFRIMNPSSALTAPVTGFSSSTTTSVEVPHCPDHKDGASISGIGSDFTIKFRSLPYLRAFCELNNTTPD